MKFQVTFTDEETKLVQKYMQDTGETISEIVLRALLERIFDDDAKLYNYEVARDRYRIIADIQDKKIVILIVDVDQRNDVYKK